MFDVTGRSILVSEDVNPSLQRIGGFVDAKFLKQSKLLYYGSIISGYDSKRYDV